MAADARARGLDGVVAWSREGTAADRAGYGIYLANYYTKFFAGLDDCPPHFAALGHAAVIVPADGDATLVVDMHYHYYPAERVAEAIDGVIHDTNVVRGVVGALKSRNLMRGRLGLVGSQIISAKHFLALKDALPDIEWLIADDLLIEPMLIKSEAEWRIIRHGCQAANEVTDDVLAAAEPGVSEFELMQRAARGLAERDCELWWLRPAGARRLESGQIYFMSVVGWCQGYFFDIARNKIVGAKAGSRRNATLDTLNEFILRQAKELEPGRTGEEAAAFGLRYFIDDLKAATRADIEAGVLCPFPAFGHGLGLNYGRPYVREGETMVLKPGMYLAIEANYADPALGMAEAEVDVEITAAGPKVLTKL
ncbi:MAG: M24 family metallopeptidase [Rhodospirillales bacterium]|nr:M24 family metallopeptidase [Rhodospirillales bacterium]